MMTRTEAAANPYAIACPRCGAPIATLCQVPAPHSEVVSSVRVCPARHVAAFTRAKRQADAIARKRAEVEQIRASIRRKRLRQQIERAS